MVIENVFDSQPTGDQPQRPKHYVALVHDRFLSLLLDIAFLIPFVSVLVSPIMKKASTLEFWGTEDWKLTALSAMAVALFSVVLFFYQMMFWYFKGQTPGQAVLGLSVLSTSRGEPVRLTLYQALVRTVLWWVSFLFFGFPFMEILIHRKGQALHDLASESWVVSHKPVKVFEATAVEKTMLGATAGLFATSFLMGALLVGAILWSRIQDDPRAHVALCGGQKMDAELSAWDGVEAKRENWTLSLVLGDVLKSECLTRLADEAFWSESSGAKDYAYLFKAFAAQDSDLKEAYFLKVCELGQDSEACRIATLEKAALLGKVPELSITTSDLKGRSPAFYASVLRHRAYFTNPLLVEAAYERLSGVGALAPFRNHHLTLNLWDRGQFAEARGALKAQLVQLNDPKKKLDELSGFCRRSLLVEESLPTECSQFSKAFAQVGSLDNPEWEKTLVLSQVRKEANPRSLSAYTKFLESRDAKQFVLAVAEAKMSNRSAGLLRLAHNSQSLYRRDALFQLSTLELNRKTLDSAKALWVKDALQDETWARSGQGLLTRFASFRSHEEGTEIVQTLEAAGRINQRSVQKVATALFTMSEKEKAYRLLQSHYSPAKGSLSGRQVGRAPASVTPQFDQVLADLESEFGPL